ncbi:MAG: hypothetical protein M3134_06820 [Actinomycetota bacterium]|nr:hypothetical protein [Actinomycetota bacterium]
MESTLGVAYGEEDRTSIFDPIEFELCDGEVISTSDIGNEYSRQIDAGVYDEVGSWVVSFQDDGAQEIMNGLKEAIDTCGTRTRPQDPQYGEDVVRLSMQGEEGNSWEVIFFRYRNVLVEVSSVSEAGDNALRIEQVAEHAERSLLQVLGGD